MSAAPIVHLVDDDHQVLRALGRLLSSAGYNHEGHSSSEEFLQRLDPDTSGCAVLDLEMPGLDGLSVQSRLASVGAGDLPVIFLTGHGTVPASVRAMKAGAVDFLVKPVEAVTFLSTVATALERNEQTRRDTSSRKSVENRMATLTRREKQVLDQVLAGRMNKQIAGDLGIAEKTVKVHRSRVMEKIGVRSIVDLVRTVGKYTN